MATAWRSKWLDWQPEGEIIPVPPETQLTKMTKSHSVSSVSSTSEKSEIIPVPADDSWRADFCGWMATACVVRDRCFGGIGSLHIEFCEWMKNNSAVMACTRQTFERLLSDAGFLIADGLVSSLILAEDWQAAHWKAEAPKPKAHGTNIAASGC